MKTQVNKRNKYPLKKILSEIEVEIGKQLNKLNSLTKSKIIKMDNCLKIITNTMEEKINSKHRKKLELQEYYQKILKTIKNKLLKIYLSIQKEYVHFVKERFVQNYVKADVKEASIKFVMRTINKIINKYQGPHK